MFILFKQCLVSRFGSIEWAVHCTPYGRYWLEQRAHCLLRCHRYLCVNCVEVVLQARLCCAVCVHARQAKAFTVIHYYNYKHSFSFTWSVVFLLLILVGRMLAVWYAVPWFTILCDECTEYRIRSTLHRRWGIGHRRWQRIYMNVSCTYLDCSVLCDITLYG